MTVDRQVDRHAVHGQQHIGRVVGGEAADHGVGGEARPLALLVHLDPAGPAEEIVGVGRKRPAQLGGRISIVVTGGAEARGRSAVTLIVSSWVTRALSGRAAYRPIAPARPSPPWRGPRGCAVNASSLTP